MSHKRAHNGLSRIIRQHSYVIFGGFKLIFDVFMIISFIFVFSVDFFVKLSLPLMLIEVIKRDSGNENATGKNF